jgi:hypothetical protein
MVDTLTTYGRRLLRRIAEAFEAAARHTRPGYALPVVTTERVQAFHDLLMDVGLDDAYDEAQSGRPDARGGGGMVGPGEALSAGAQAEEAGDVSGDTLRRLRMQFLEDGRLAELNQIILDIPERRAGDVPTDVVEAALANFTIAYARHIATLVGTHGGLE